MRTTAERAPPQEVVGILLQTIRSLQEDTDKGRSLAQKVVAKYSSKPVVVKKKVIKLENEAISRMHLLFKAGISRTQKTIDKRRINGRRVAYKNI